MSQKRTCVCCRVPVSVVLGKSFTADAPAGEGDTVLGSAPLTRVEESPRQARALPSRAPGPAGIIGAAVGQCPVWPSRPDTSTPTATNAPVGHLVSQTRKLGPQGFSLKLKSGIMTNFRSSDSRTICILTTLCCRLFKHSSLPLT